MAEEDAALVRQFLAAAKAFAPGVRWTQRTWSDRGGGQGHPDYRDAKFVILVVDGSLEGGELRLQAHAQREPRKYGFALLWQRRPVLRLDVNPGSTHFNASTKTSVAGTHWQAWPDCEAEPDARTLVHRQWLDAFCDLALIERPGTYEPPPFIGNQGNLL